MSEYMIVPVLLTFSNGEKRDAEFTMPKKAYWQGQLENEIMRRYNHNAPPRKLQGRKGESLPQHQRGRDYDRYSTWACNKSMI